MKNQNIYILIFIIILLIFGFYLYNPINYTVDQDFVLIIKNMAIKNHDNPNLFLDMYNQATTNDEKVKAVLTNRFYECVYNNIDKIQTKTDVNLFCGNFIRF